MKFFELNGHQPDDGSGEMSFSPKLMKNATFSHTNTHRSKRERCDVEYTNDRRIDCCRVSKMSFTLIHVHQNIATPARMK